MGALPNTLPRTPRKPVGKSARPSSKLNQYGRDPGSPSERLRASSDYDKETGYAPFFHAFLADWGRLSSGHVSDMMFMAVLSRGLGRGAKKGEARPARTLALAVEELAALVNPKNPPVRSVERELVRWHEAKIAHVQKEGKGLVSIELLYRGWESLPDYVSEVIQMEPAPAEVVEPESVDESKPGNQRVTGKKAVRLAAGSVSKVFPVSCGVRQFRYRADGPIDLDITAVIQAGELVVTSRLPDAWLEKLANMKSSSNVSNDLNSATRHGRREAAPVKHPRAGELVALFDPLLGKSGSVLLAMDRPSLSSACEAVGDCDHDYLVKFAVQRAANPIRKPGHVAMICKEALASWKASSKVLDGTRLSKAQLDAMVEKERAELARKRAELRGRK